MLEGTFLVIRSQLLGSTASHWLSAQCRALKVDRREGEEPTAAVLEPVRRRPWFVGGWVCCPPLSSQGSVQVSTEIVFLFTQVCQDLCAVHVDLFRSVSTHHELPRAEPRSSKCFHWLQWLIDSVVHEKYSVLACGVNEFIKIIYSLEKWCCLTSDSQPDVSNQESFGISDTSVVQSGYSWCSQETRVPVLVNSVIPTVVLSSKLEVDHTMLGKQGAGPRMVWSPFCIWENFVSRSPGLLDPA